MLSPRNPFSLAAVDGVLQPFGCQRILAAHVDIALARAGDKSRDRHAFDDGEGIAFHHYAIFECARLGFIGIADYVVAVRHLRQELRCEKRFPFFCRLGNAAPPRPSKFESSITSRSVPSGPSSIRPAQSFIASVSSIVSSVAAVRRPDAVKQA